MVFKRELTPLSRRGRIDKHKGKGSTIQQLLPSRNAVGRLARDPYASPNDYAKATPGLDNPTPGIFDTDQDEM